MDAPMESLKRRDVKGLYEMAERGEMNNIIGLDIPFERPVGSDLVIDSSEDDPDLVSLTHHIMERAGLV